jgi:hypothetical protein
VLLLAILAVLRLGVVSHPIPVHGDEMEFVAALGFPEAYGVHQPGYPGWIALGSLLRAAGLSPYAAFAAWALVGSLAAPWLLYALLRRFVSQATAWWAALAYGAGPLVWFHGATALNYTFAAAVGLGIAWFLLAELSQPATRRSAFWAVLLLACGLSIRPDLLLWYAPLLMWAAWRAGRATFAQAVLLVALGLAALFALHAWAYGRSAADLGGPKVSDTIGVIFRTSVFRLGLVDGLARSGLKLGTLLTWGMGLGAFLTVAAIPGFLRFTASRRSLRTAVLLWLAPPAVFLLLIHMSEAGHVLPVLAPLYVLAAVGLSADDALRAASWLRAAAVVSILQFAFYPWSADSAGIQRLP